MADIGIASSVSYRFQPAASSPSRDSGRPVEGSIRLRHSREPLAALRAGPSRSERREERRRSAREFRTLVAFLLRVLVATRSFNGERPRGVPTVGGRYYFAQMRAACSGAKLELCGRANAPRRGGEAWRRVVQRCYRLSGIHYSGAMKPVFTDKPANVSATERRDVT